MIIIIGRSIVDVKYQAPPRSMLLFFVILTTICRGAQKQSIMWMLVLPRTNFTTGRLVSRSRMVVREQKIPLSLQRVIKKVQVKSPGSRRQIALRKPPLWRKITKFSTQHSRLCLILRARWFLVVKMGQNILGDIGEKGNLSSQQIN